MRGLLFAITLTTLAVASRSDYVSFQRKVQQIEKKQVKPGSRVSFTAREVNSYLEEDLMKLAPPGFRRPAAQLQGNNTASGTALIDFVKLRSARGQAPSWIVRKLLEGEHEVTVTAKLVSGGGKMTINLQSVEIAGIPISGGVLDFLIRNYLVPNYPDAKVGKPFELKYGIDRIDVQPGVAHVVMR
jgi:hypothetical protein